MRQLITISAKKTIELVHNSSLYSTTYFTGLVKTLYLKKLETKLSTLQSIMQRLETAINMSDSFIGYIFLLSVTTLAAHFIIYIYFFLQRL